MFLFHLNCNGAISQNPQLSSLLRYLGCFAVTLPTCKIQDSIGWTHISQSGMKVWKYVVWTTLKGNVLCRHSLYNLQRNRGGTQYSLSHSHFELKNLAGLVNPSSACLLKSRQIKSARTNNLVTILYMPNLEEGINCRKTKF